MKKLFVILSLAVAFGCGGSRVGRTNLSSEGYEDVTRKLRGSDRNQAAIDGIREFFGIKYGARKTFSARSSNESGCTVAVTSQSHAGEASVEVVLVEDTTGREHFFYLTNNAKLHPLTEYTQSARAMLLTKAVPKSDEIYDLVLVKSKSASTVVVGFSPDGSNRWKNRRGLECRFAH